MKKEVSIIGAGLVGSLCALYMTRRGYVVNVFERRKDLRSEIITAGKSINLALSKRGWTSLEKAGIDKEVMKIAIPVYRRLAEAGGGRGALFQAFQLQLLRGHANWRHHSSCSELQF